MLTRLTQMLLLIGALTTVGFMLFAGEPGTLVWWALFVPFAAWALFPFWLVASAARKHEGSRVDQRMALLAAALITGFGLFVLYSAFVTDPDPQSGLVLLFLPLWQLAGLLPFWALSRLLARRHPST